MPKTTCPYCFKPTIDFISPPYPLQHESVDKVNELRRKIRRLDEAAAQLSKHRTELLKKFKEVQLSISILPRELLSRIFQFVCSPPKFGSSSLEPDLIRDFDEERRNHLWYKQKLILTRVSANWRRTVMTEPQLWTTVRLHIYSVATKKDIVSLCQFFEYSGHLPLTLSILFRDYDDEDGFSPDTHLIHSSIDSLLLKNFWRIENLHLDRPHQIWISHLPQLQKMTHFFLVNAHGPPPNLSLSHISSLSELTLVGRPTMISSPYLTILNLHQVPLNVIFRAMINCPNLIELHLRPSNRVYDGDTVLPVETFALQRLEVLEWTMLNSMDHLDITWETAILNHIHTPSLRALSFTQPLLYFSQMIPTRQGAVSRFFARLPTTLSSLEFVGIRNERLFEDNLLTPFNQNLRDDCHIESLAFVDCHFRFLAGALQNLTSSLRFPRLCRITVDQIFCARTPHQQMDMNLEQRLQQISFLSSVFLEMVEKRVDVSERRLALYMTRNGGDMEWLNHIRSELAELKRGRQLDIFVNSKLVT